MDSFDRFNETSLPPIEEFNSQLYKKYITEEVDQNAKNVWKTLNITNMGEYQDLCLKSDALLQARTFERYAWKTTN